MLQQFTTGFIKITTDDINKLEQKDQELISKYGEDVQKEFAEMDEITKKFG